MDGSWVNTSSSFFLGREISELWWAIQLLSQHRLATRTVSATTMNFKTGLRPQNCSAKVEPWSYGDFWSVFKEYDFDSAQSLWGLPLVTRLARWVFQLTLSSLVNLTEMWSLGLPSPSKKNPRLSEWFRNVGEKFPPYWPSLHLATNMRNSRDTNLITCTCSGI